MEAQALARDRRFFALMAAAALLVVFAGFAPTYYLRSALHLTVGPNGKPLAPHIPPVVQIHAIVFSLWIVTFGVQAGLVATRRVAMHRRLGMIAAWLIPIMIVLGLVTAIRGARDGWNPGGPFPDALGFLIVGFADLTVFGTLAAAGIWFRRRPDLHRRLMLFATLGGLMWPSITRIWFIAPHLPAMLGVFATLVLAPTVRDFWLRSRTRWISLAVSVALLARFPLSAAIGNSDVWRRFAAWLVGG
jgi:hypothetical protein